MFMGAIILCKTVLPNCLGGVSPSRKGRSKYFDLKGVGAINTFPMERFNKKERIYKELYPPPFILVWL